MMLRTCRAAFLAAFALVLMLPLVQADEQPTEVPTEFRNGQENAFGRIAMPPYVEARGRETAPVEARIELRDMGALMRAESVMLALTLHEPDAGLAVAGAFAPDGSPIPAERSGTDGKGLQAQLFLSADELRGRAKDGVVSLIFRGHAVPDVTGQLHVGVLAVAYNADWAETQSADGPAKLYAYSLVQSDAGGGLMPFHGQGNTMIVVPIVVLAAFVLFAGGLAAQTIRVERPLMPAIVETIPTFGAPAQPLRRIEVAAAPHIEFEDAVPPPTPVPVFGGPASPVLGKPAVPPATEPRPERPILNGRVQGPHLPPHWRNRPATAAETPPDTPAPTAPASDDADSALRPPPTPPEEPRPAEPAPAPVAEPASKPKAPARRPKRPAASKGAATRRAPARKAEKDAKAARAAAPQPSR